MTTVALHACCGPCLLEPLDALASEHAVTVVYANPNIQPHEEYERRRDTLLGYAGERALDVVEVPYDPSRWAEATADSAADRAGRCEACWRLRLELTATVAEERGLQALASTLSVSPYQDAAVLDSVAREVARRHGLLYLGADWRERYPDATRRSRELGMYRQNYCGCLPSRAEAEEDRTRRREERRQARAARAEGAERS